MTASPTTQPLTVQTLRISVTDRCNLRCIYCMPPEGAELCPHDEVMRFEEIARVADVLRSEFGLHTVRLTGGEPLIKRGLTDLIRLLADLGVEDLALTTNAQQLAECASEIKAAGLHRVNISLNSLDAERYARLSSGGDVANTLRGIQGAIDADLTPVRINAVVLRGENDAEVVDLARFALDRGCEIRFLELMPLAVARPIHNRYFVPTREVRQAIGAAFDIAPLPHTPGTPSRRWRARDAEGREGVIGFISSETDSFCDGCRRLRLTARGRLIGCLAHDDGVELLPILRGNGAGKAALSNAVRQAFASKTNHGRFRGSRSMVSIGG